MTRENKRSGDIEYRTIELTDTALTAGGNNLEGVAVRWGSPGEIGTRANGGFTERFMAGAFTASLDKRDVVLLDNHDTARPLARTGAGTLTVRQDDDATRWTAQPTDTSYARDVLTNVRSGNYGGCSFGFRPTNVAWFDDAGNPSNPQVGTVREVRGADLFEISISTFPVYTDTDVSARSVIDAAREVRAAKATYSDLDTCGECGSTGQYGKYCANCGEPMSEPKTAGKFCSACGTSLDGERSNHACETRATSTDSADDGNRSAVDMKIYEEKFRHRKNKGDF